MSITLKAKSRECEPQSKIKHQHRPLQSELQDSPGDDKLFHILLKVDSFTLLSVKLILAQGTPWGPAAFTIYLQHADPQEVILTLEQNGHPRGAHTHPSPGFPRSPVFCICNC